MKTISLFSCIFLLLILAVISCGKDDNGPAKPPDSNCRIASATSKSGGTTVTYILSYDNDGRVNKISMDDFYKTRYHFNYVQGTLTRSGYSDHWDGQQTSELRAELNGMGLPTLITDRRYDYTPAGQPLKLISVYTYTYEYNSKGELQAGITKTEYPGNPGNNTEYTYTYSWNNGNIVKQEASNGSTVNYEYYTDKPLQKGDPVIFDGMVSYGVSPFKNKNLVKSITDGTTIINMNYEYDENGKVKIATLSGNGAAGSRDMRYQYACN